jgi:hypothetical protein
MILVINSKQFNKEFPELFPWGAVDSYKLADLGVELSRRAESDLENPSFDRWLVAGLRVALVAIAKIAETEEA